MFDSGTEIIYMKLVTYNLLILIFMFDAIESDNLLVDFFLNIVFSLILFIFNPCLLVFGAYSGKISVSDNYLLRIRVAKQPSRL